MRYKTSLYKYIKTTSYDSSKCGANKNACIFYFGFLAVILTTHFKNRAFSRFPGELHVNDYGFIIVSDKGESGFSHIAQEPSGAMGRPNDAGLRAFSPNIIFNTQAIHKRRSQESSNTFFFL